VRQADRAATDAARGATARGERDARLIRQLQAALHSAEVRGRQRDAEISSLRERLSASLASPSPSAAGGAAGGGDGRGDKGGTSGPERTLTARGSAGSLNDAVKQQLQGGLRRASSHTGGANTGGGGQVTRAVGGGGRLAAAEATAAAAQASTAQAQQELRRAKARGVGRTTP
jgi:hypothetical protein